MPATHSGLGLAFGYGNVLCAGLLAGEEFAVCYGLRSSFASLDERSHIRLRQALIRRLRVLVPIVLDSRFSRGSRSPSWKGWITRLLFGVRD